MVRATTKVEEVKVGVIDAFSGFLAKTCGWNKKAFMMAEEDINKAGGIKSLGGAKIKLIFADNEGKAPVGMAVAEKLCNEGVVALVGSYQSDVSFAITQVAEKYKVPILVPVGVADEITERGFKYTFRHNVKASWLSRDTFEFIEYISKKTGVKPKTAVILGNDSSYPQSVGKGHMDYAQKTGLVKIIGNFSYPMKTSDLSTEISKIKSLKPDLLLSTCYLPDGILITRTLKELDVNLMGHIMIGGPLEIEFAQTLGRLAEDILTCTGGWNPDVKIPGAKELNQKFKERFGRDMASITAMCYGTIYTLKEALEMAASVDREKLRESLTMINIPIGKGIMAHGVKFGPDGQNVEAKNLMLQIRDGKLVTVWPPNVAPSEARWPLPNWKE
jgi:branched-chain amino acid transport system substrate-binding protein